MACTSLRPRCAEAAADLDREALFRAHLGWAAAIARNVHRKLPPSFELDDLVQFAYLELWKRARLYDPQRNDSFQGFAYLPIRGAVLMSCRRRLVPPLKPEAALLACERTDAERTRLVQFLEPRWTLAEGGRWIARKRLGVPLGTLPENPVSLTIAEKSEFRYAP